VKFYQTELRDGKPKRVQKSEKLCRKDLKHFSTACKPVQDLAAKVMNRVNAESGALAEQDVLITDFWQVFIKHCEETNEDGTRNVKHSTQNGWEKLWRLYLAPELAGIGIKQMTTQRATLLLTKITKEHGLGERTVQHIKSLGHRLFKHAQQTTGLVSGVNPFRDANTLNKAKAKKQTHAYTLQEAQAIMAVLTGEPEALLMFCLGMFCGLRPGEISGVQWTGLQGTDLLIQRSVWRGNVGTTKMGNEELVPVIRQVRQLLEQWRLVCPASKDNWVFPNRNGGPKSAEFVAFSVIKPLCEQAGIYWDGLYSARRGASSAYGEITGNSLAGARILRHNPKTDEAAYLKINKELADKAVALLEEKVSNLNLLPKMLPAPQDVPMADELTTDAKV